MCSFGDAKEDLLSGPCRREFGFGFSASCRLGTAQFYNQWCSRISSWVCLKLYRLNISPAIEIATFNILLAMPQGSFLGAFVVGWLRYRGITSRKTHQNIIAPYYFDTDLLLFSTPFFWLVVSNLFLISISDMGCHPSHWRTYLYFSRWLLHHQPGIISEFFDYIPTITIKIGMTYCTRITSICFLALCINTLLFGGWCYY